MFTLNVLDTSNVTSIYLIFRILTSDSLSFVPQLYLDINALSFMGSALGKEPDTLLDFTYREIEYATLFKKQKAKSETSLTSL